jgi:hypothetical protein
VETLEAQFSNENKREVSCEAPLLMEEFDGESDQEINVKNLKQCGSTVNGRGDQASEESSGPNFEVYKEVPQKDFIQIRDQYQKYKNARN